MYIYLHFHTYISIYINTYIFFIGGLMQITLAQHSLCCIYTHMCICLYTNIYIYICLYIWISIYIYNFNTFIHLFSYICIRTPTSLSISLDLCIRTLTHTHIYTHTHVCVYEFRQLKCTVYRVWSCCCANGDSTSTSSGSSSPTTRMGSLGSSSTNIAPPCMICKASTGALLAQLPASRQASARAGSSPRTTGTALHTHRSQGNVRALLDNGSAGNWPPWSAHTLTLSINKEETHTRTHRDTNARTRTYTPHTQKHGVLHLSL